MKSTYIIITLFFLLLNSSCKIDDLETSKTYNGYVLLSKQNLDLPKLLDDLKNKEIINGDLIILDFNNKYLEFLKSIKIVKGGINIENTSITDLSFLSSLETVVGSIFITQNPLLTSIKGLDNLKKAGGFELYGSYPTLQSFDLSYIQNTEITGTFNLHYLANDSIPFFKNITNLGNGLILYKTKIKNLKSFSNLKTVGSQINLVDNSNLINLEGLENVEAVGGSFMMSGNVNLESLKGLENLKQVKFWFQIWSTKIKSLSYLSELKTVEDLSIQQSAISDLSGLEGLLNVKVFHFTLNPKLSNYCALKPFLARTNLNGKFYNKLNLQNPTIEEIITNCK